MSIVEVSEAEEANSKLTQGLKSCRAVLKNYRLLLSNDGEVAQPLPDDGQQAGADPVETRSSSSDEL